MKRRMHSLLALLLALVMTLSLAAPAAPAAADPADVPEQETAERESGTQLELSDLDPQTLHVPKLGEVTEEEKEVPEELHLDRSPEETVRVSIFLNEKATLDAGYSAEGVGTNGAAVSYRDSLKAQQRSVTAQIEKSLGHTLEVRWNLTLLVNAISAYVKVKEIPAIEQIPGVASVEYENRYEAMTGSTPEDPNTSNTSQYMVGATAAWADGYTGAGSRIAIIDTGIDTTHQSFAADAFNYSIGKLADAPTLMTADDITKVRSQLNGVGKYYSSKIPFGYNYVDQNNTDIVHTNDTEGEHGSHVAGIAAANRYIKSGSSYNDAASTVYAVGMAPDAQLVVMKVFGSGGGAYDSDYMAAIEDAVVLGCDAANLSLGGGSQGWTYDGTYQEKLNALTSAKNPNMVVTISAGNAGALDDELETNLYIEDVSQHTGGSPGSYVNSLGVASADNIGNTGSPLVFNGNQTVFYTDSDSSAAMPSVKGSYSFVYIDAVGEASDYSTVNSAVSLRGKVVMVNRGSINFADKATNASSYSPKALLVANNESGSISMSVEGFTGSFPVASITLEDAVTLKANSTSAAAGGITYYTGTVVVSDQTTSGQGSPRSSAQVSSFSSWGVPGSLLMKPEITAPGGNIYSVFGTNKTASGSTAGGSTKYETMSGTSMAAPHMAGLTAVMAEYLRGNDFSAKNSTLTANYSQRAIIQSLLMSTATPMKPDGYLSVLQQGAGLADVSAAVRASSVIMMDEAGLTTRTKADADGKVKFEFGDDPEKEGVYTYSFTIYNLRDRNLDYELKTDLFTQKRSGEFMDHATTDLGAANVSYQWEAIDGGSSESHDVDKDGDTDNNDTQAILDYLTGERAGEELNLAAGEMDEDGKLTTKDAQLLIDWQPEGGSAYGPQTVPANGKRSVTVTIRLTEAQKANLNANYPKGAYIEGFTYVTCKTKTAEGASFEHEHSIPILGFYGSWTDPSMFDCSTYTDQLYGAGKTSYTGNETTNYLTVNQGGSNVMFSGNPYMVEESFPADRLAMNSNNTLVRVTYNLLRPAGTTGFAVTKLDENHDVTQVLSAPVQGNEVEGIWFYQAQGTWQNLTSRSYAVNKTISSYGLQEGDRFRAGFYAIPEYHAMQVNTDLTDGGAGILSDSGFQTLLKKNTLGMGALVGYDFVVDNTDPEVVNATLNDDQTITVEVSDDRNLAYVAVLSLDGTVKYAEQAPGAPTCSITFDASDAVANAPGYVAVFAGDYAGNEAARAVKVNDNAYEDRTVYVLTDSLSAGNDYLIVNRNSSGSAYALGRSGSTVATNAVTVLAANGQVSEPYIDSADVASTSVWTVSGSYIFKNGNYYLRRSNQNALQIGTTNSNNAWSWDGTNHRLSINSRYLRYYNNTFSLSTAQNSVYLYQKTVIHMAVDPYRVSKITLTPETLNLYRGNEADLSAKVSPLTAGDRSITWSTSNPAVATVDQSGQVTAAGAGTAVITATSNGDSSVSASCEVNVVSVDKQLNAIIWDEEGGEYFSSFNANGLPAWTKLHSDAKGSQLHSAFMNSSTELYAASLDMDAQSSVLYTVNRGSYGLTEYGTNYVLATDLARGSSYYTEYFVYSFGQYLVFGNLEPEEDEEEEGTFSGIPYGLLDASTTIGDAYIAAVAARSIGSTSSVYYFLDENGKIWQTTLTIGNDVSFSTPSLVVDTGIATSFFYQSLYYDGTYLYWTHQDGDHAELILINPTSKVVYHAGDFGADVWPVTGVYVDGAAAPAERGGETLSGLSPLASREELLTDAVRERFAAEAEKFASKAPKTSEEAETEAETEAAETLEETTEAPENVTEETTEAEVTEETVTDEETAEVSEEEVTEEVTEAEVISSEEEEPLPSGSLHAIRVTASDPAKMTPVTEADGGVTVTYTEDTAAANGLVTVTYDPQAISYTGASSDLTYHSVHADPEQGVITFAFANKTPAAAGTELAKFFFTAACEDSEIVVLTKELGDQLNLNRTETEPVSGKGHAWGTPSYSWSEDYSEVTASVTCANDASHVLTETVQTTEERTEPGCESTGSVIYTAVFTNQVFTAQYKVVMLPATGHAWGEPSYVWSEDNSQVTATAVCEHDASHVQTETVQTTSVTEEPTCEEAGSITYTAAFTKAPFTGQTKSVEIPATGHAWGAPVWSWAEDYSSAEAAFTCERDAEHVQTVTDAAPVETEVLAADCENDRVVTYTATVTGPDGKTYTDTTDEVTLEETALGHVWKFTGFVWTGDEENGYTGAAAEYVCEREAEHKTSVSAVLTSASEDATCETAGKVIYTASVSAQESPDGAAHSEQKTMNGVALGHAWGAPVWSWAEDYSSATAAFTCEHDAEHVSVVQAKINVVPGTGEEEGKLIYTAAASAPDGKGPYLDVVKVDLPKEILRVYGNNRVKTGLAVAEEIKKELGVEKFDAVILTTGENFADALAGSYLAVRKNAPILLTGEKYVTLVNTYLQNNLAEGATIYALGGEKALPESWLAGLEGFDVQRIAGKTRYLTALEILEEAGVEKGEEVLICTGEHYADSLSAASSGKPLFFVKETLSEKQKTMLAKLVDLGCTFTILGGTNAVSEEMKALLRAEVGTALKERIAGNTRYKTSAMIAEKFYPRAKQLILVTGENFPDGLCGGLLGALLDMPIVLTTEGKETAAVDYAAARMIQSGIVLGGTKAISDELARKVFRVDESVEIKESFYK